VALRGAVGVHDPPGGQDAPERRARTVATMPSPRIPYVGCGVDGCVSSARLDLEEAKHLAAEDPRRQQLIDSARAWLAQADQWADET
jgi:hypothetical protein